MTKALISNAELERIVKRIGNGLDIEKRRSIFEALVLVRGTYERELASRRSKPTPPPTMTPEVRAELNEALKELDAAFGGKKGMPTAESQNARLFVEALWQWQQQKKSVAVAVNGKEST